MVFHSASFFSYPSVYFLIFLRFSPSLSPQPPLPPSLFISVDGSFTSSLPKELLVRPVVNKDRDIDVTAAERRQLSWSLCLSFCHSALSVPCHSLLVLSKGFHPLSRRGDYHSQGIDLLSVCRTVSNDCAHWVLSKRPTKRQRERVSAAWVRVQ